MTNQLVQLDQLDIIGYADALPGRKGPAVIPPVFLDRNDIDQCFVPPFRIAGNWLIEPQPVAFAEVQELAQEGRITLFADLPRPALPEHQLWVDAGGQAHYEPAPDARRNLQRIHRESLNAATAAFREGKFDEAERQAGIALAANDRTLEPRALISACHALRGEEKQVVFMRQAAEAVGHCPETIALLMKSYMEMIPAATWESVSPDATRAACAKVGVEAQRRFVLPTDVKPFVGAVLMNASISQSVDSFEVQCMGPDVAFLEEFLLLFKHNYLATMSGGQAVEVVRKAYWTGKNRRTRVSPPLPRSVEDYFSRLGDVLVDTGVLGFVEKKSAAGQIGQ